MKTPALLALSAGLMLIFASLGAILVMMPSEEEKLRARDSFKDPAHPAMPVRLTSEKLLNLQEKEAMAEALPASL